MSCINRTTEDVLSVIPCSPQMKLSIPFSLLFLDLFCNHGDSLSQSYGAIFSFGASYSDTGNMAVLDPACAANNVPYGMTFFGQPTGRYSDGRLIIDFLAQGLGLPFLPPSLSKGQSFSHGANFAVAGATALGLAFFEERNITGVPPTLVSMGDQLQWFEKLKPNICNTTQECMGYFSDKLFIVGEFGWNDYSYAMAAGRGLEEAKSFVPAVIEAISLAVETLIEQGARHLVVPGNVPTGCVPYVLAVHASPNKTDYDPKTGCLRSFNGLAMYHNSQVRQALCRLRNKHPEARIAYGDYYTPVFRFAEDPIRFGFTSGALEVCCGGGGPYNCNASARCGRSGASAQKDPSTFVNWDGVHLTEASHLYIAQGFLNGSYVHPPILGRQDFLLPGALENP